jgi:hypothetical protein
MKKLKVNLFNENETNDKTTIRRQPCNLVYAAVWAWKRIGCYAQYDRRSSACRDCELNEQCKKKTRQRETGESA